MRALKKSQSRPITIDDCERLQRTPFRKILSLWDALKADGVSDADLGKYDRFYLLVTLLHREDAWHSWLYARCREVEAEPDGCLDLWSREHYKSSIVTFAGVIQEILLNPDITVGIFSHTKSIARKFLAQIKLELEGNRELQSVYPGILWQNPGKESPRWSLDGGIIVKRRSNPKEATVEGHGLVDGMPTGAHFSLLVYDDVVTLESVSTPEQVTKTTDAWALSDNLGARGPDGMIRKWHLGTRYCTVADTKILMADWSHKPIQDVCVGDMVIGWAMKRGTRWLKAVQVTNTGTHLSQPVNQYTFNSGRSVTCTPDHRWWRGPHGSGDEYQALTVPAKRNRRTDGVSAVGDPHRTAGQRRGLSRIRELLVPIDSDLSRDAGWLAGMFDGEGTTKKNPHHPSGVACITQTLHNPEIIEETRRVLTTLGFTWSESWLSAKGHERMTHDRCVFLINGGWRERYRFLAQIAPTKTRALAPTLFGALHTESRKLISVENAGLADVFWLETETGNYIADGFCSKNSYADTYQYILDRKILKPRIYPATEDGTADGKPVFLSNEAWAEKKKTQPLRILAAQMLQNPSAGNQALFDKAWLKFAEIRPATINVYILCDPASSQKKTSDRTAMAAIAVDAHLNKILIDGFHHRMKLAERWQRLRDLRRKWMRAPGVQIVRVGYERYGSTSDLEYFEERMREEKDSFEIAELAWPKTGEVTKFDRIQRLEPDFRAGRIQLIGVYDGVTSNQKRMADSGQEFRVLKPVRQIDEDRRAYSLNKSLLDEYLVYPFSIHDDFLDAMSRIYDIDYTPPVIIDERALEPEI